LDFRAVDGQVGSRRTNQHRTVRLVIKGGGSVAAERRCSLALSRKEPKLERWWVRRLKVEKEKEKEKGGAGICRAGSTWRRCGTRESEKRGEKGVGRGGVEKQRGTEALLYSRSFRWQKGQARAVKAVRAVTGPANRMA